MKKPLPGRLYLLCLSLISTSILFAQPANNDCSGAVTLTPGSPAIAATLFAATSSTGAPAVCAGGYANNDVWYKFTAAGTAAKIVVTSIGTQLAISGITIQLISSSNNACNGTLASMFCSTTGTINATGLTNGKTYFIRVYSPSSTGFTATNAVFSIGLPFVGSTMSELFQKTNLTTGMLDPWEITYGPDNMLWITEAKGYKIYRMNPNTGTKTVILDLINGATGYLTAAEHSAYNRNANFTTVSFQGGLAGLALHPDWANKKYVYVSYGHSYNSSAANSGGVFFTNRIVRFTYNTSTNKLESPTTICDTLPGSGDHNSQRMIIAPVGGVDYLFYAAGDMGAGQFGNAQRPIKAQFTGAYEGKILRFNLEPDGDAGAGDKWIPNGNPYNTTSPAKQNAVWCIGIRNNQGFAYANGMLYGSSHGPYSDDEINIIDSNKNYGHPFVIGDSTDNNYKDSRAGHKNGSDATIMPLITDEGQSARGFKNSDGVKNYRNPVFSAYPSTQAEIYNIWWRADQNNSPIPNGDWPSEGWSGLGYYSYGIIPNWKNSLIACSLKWGRLVRMKLDATNADIMPINGVDTATYFQSQNRFRDLAFDPNGKDIYVAMDNSTTSSGPSTAFPVVPSCTGCVQKYSFLGYSADAAGKSSIPTVVDVTSGTISTCNTGTTITIDNTNNYLWVPITGPDGNIMAEINANGNNLGTVTSSFYMHSGATRIKSSVRLLNRNLTITPATQPTTPVKIRLYVKKGEVDALVTAGGIGSYGNLKILKNNDGCTNLPQSSTTLITPTSIDAHGANGYVLQANISGFSSFYFGGANVTLPVQLLTFTGALQNNVTLLNWTTENEINTSHFVIERSIDGVNFSALGNVKANGNSNGPLNYSYTDEEVMSLDAAIVYYRLKAVDIKNESKYSEIISVVVPGMSDVVSVSPNPVATNTQVRIAATTNGTVKWILIDNAGRIVQSNQVAVQKSKITSFPVHMGKLAKGSYYLQLSGAGLDKNIKLQKL